MKRVISALLPVVLVVILGQTQRIDASHQRHFGSIDEIDAFLPEGGGIFSGSLSDVNDDDWVGFFATAGDTLSITFTTAQFAMDGVVFREVTNGILEVATLPTSRISALIGPVKERTSCEAPMT